MLDASDVLTEACFAAWLEFRGGLVPADGAKTFQRVLTSHVTGAPIHKLPLSRPGGTHNNAQSRARHAGSDGRQPFEADEEAAVLAALRVKRVWPAFANGDSSIGRKGFRSYGFHEARSSFRSGSANTPL